MCKQSILCANRIFYALFNYSFCSKFTMIRCIHFLHCELWMFQLIYTLNAFISYSFRNSIYLHTIYLLLYKFFLYTILVDVLFVVTLEIFFLFFFFHYVIWFFTCYITSNQLTFSFVHLSIFVSRFFFIIVIINVVLHFNFIYIYTFVVVGLKRQKTEKCYIFVVEFSLCTFEHLW